MERSKMYSKRRKNIGSFRGCGYDCIYCAFRKTLSRVTCPKCKAFEPHEHLESFHQKPLKTAEGEFNTIGLSGDIAFASDTWFLRTQEYCAKWKDRTFLVQSKNPMCLVTRLWTQNVVLGTTIETNRTRFSGMSKYRKYEDISKAPVPIARKEQLRQFAKDNKVAVTIEPIMDFDLTVLWYWMVELQPKWIWIGYDSGNHKLPEPELEETQQLIEELREAGFEVFEKLLRPAWWE